MKEVIWLELQAWFAGNDVNAQDQSILHERRLVDQVLSLVGSYRYELLLPSLRNIQKDFKVYSRGKIMGIKNFSPAVCRIKHKYWAKHIFCYTGRISGFLELAFISKLITFSRVTFVWQRILREHVQMEMKWKTRVLLKMISMRVWMCSVKKEQL